MLKIDERKIIDDSRLVKIEIYKLTCKKTNKSYIGQAVTHVLNHKKYRRYGSHGRFLKHVSEIYCESKKRKQCWYLNNAIKKYGSESFSIEVVCVCEKNQADHYETIAIQKFNTLYPNGYNLRTGGQNFQHTDESKKRVSDGVKNFFENKRIARFQGIILESNKDPEKLIRPLRKYGQQYGWYIKIKGIKTDFGGVHLPLNESYDRALNFIKILQGYVKIQSNDLQKKGNGQSAAKPGNGKGSETRR